MKCFHLDCTITIEAESGQRAFEILCDLLLNNDIALTVTTIEDEDGERVLREGGGHE